MYYLYEIKSGEKIYIGITSSFDRRMKEHKNNSTNRGVNKYVKEFGWETLSKRILCMGDFDYISDLERVYINNLFVSNKDRLWNNRKGGHSGGSLPGENHWNSKLTEEDVILIRELYADNKMTQRDIADIFPVEYKAISKIVRGQRWSEVGGPITLYRQPISKVANRAKLNINQIADIREEAKELYLEGLLHIATLGDIYSVSRGNMRKILKGDTYKEVSGPILGIDYWEDFGNGRQ